MQNLMDEEIEKEYWNSAMRLAIRVERQANLVKLEAPAMIIDAAENLVNAGITKFTLARQKYEAMVEPDSLESTNIDKE